MERPPHRLTVPTRRSWEGNLRDAASVRTAEPRLSAGDSSAARRTAPRGLDAGLIFIAYQPDPRKGFVPVQRSLAANDEMNEYIRHVSSGLFACPPGVSEGGYRGDGLFT